MILKKGYFIALSILLTSRNIGLYCDYEARQEFDIGG